MENIMMQISIATEDRQIVLRQPWPEEDLAPNQFIGTRTDQIEIVISAEQIPILVKWLQQATTELQG